MWAKGWCRSKGPEVDGCSKGLSQWKGRAELGAHLRGTSGSLSKGCKEAHPFSLDRQVSFPCLPQPSLSSVPVPASAQPWARSPICGW